MGTFLLQNWGVSDSQYGYMFCLCAFSFVGSVSWSLLADKTRKHKLILILATICCTAFFVPLRAYHMFASTSSMVRLAFVCLCYGGSNFCISALYPLLDNRVFELLSGDPRFTKGLFGRQRLFGIFGQSIISIITGWLIQRYGYDMMFLTFLVSSLLFIVMVHLGIQSDGDAISNRQSLTKVQSDGTDADAKYLVSQTKDTEMTKGPVKFSLMTSFLQIITTFDFFIFLLVMLIASSVRAVVGHYLPRYFEKSMELKTGEYPIRMQLRLIPEVILLFWGKEIFDTIGNPKALLIGQISGVIRTAAYAFIPTALQSRYTLPLYIELLKGVNNACITAAGARYVHEIAPPGAATSAQGIFSGVHCNLSYAAAGIFGGVVLKMEEKNPLAYQVLFKYTTYAGLVGCLLFGLHQTWVLTGRRTP